MAATTISTRTDIAHTAHTETQIKRHNSHRNRSKEARVRNSSGVCEWNHDWSEEHLCCLVSWRLLLLQCFLIFLQRSLHPLFVSQSNRLLSNIAVVQCRRKEKLYASLLQHGTHNRTSRLQHDMRQCAKTTATLHASVWKNTCNIARVIVQTACNTARVSVRRKFDTLNPEVSHKWTVHLLSLSLKNKHLPNCRRIHYLRRAYRSVVHERLTDSRPVTSMTMSDIQSSRSIKKSMASEDERYIQIPWQSSSRPHTCKYNTVVTWHIDQNLVQRHQSITILVHVRLLWIARTLLVQQTTNRHYNMPVVNKYTDF